jgi:hypothetical protein
MKAAYLQGFRSIDDHLVDQVAAMSCQVSDTTFEIGTREHRTSWGQDRVL